MKLTKKLLNLFGQTGEFLGQVKEVVRMRHFEFDQLDLRSLKKEINLEVFSILVHKIMGADPQWSYKSILVHKIIPLNRISREKLLLMVIIDIIFLLPGSLFRLKTDMTPDPPQSWPGFPGHWTLQLRPESRWVRSSVKQKHFPT